LRAARAAATLWKGTEFLRAASHGLSRGIINIAQGGSFKSGFASAGRAAGAVRALSHGLSRAAISAVRGGKAMGGFLSGFAGSILGGFVKGLEYAEGRIGTIIKVTMTAIAGGTASALGGGKFANGAMSTAFIMLFNEFGDKMIDGLNLEESSRKNRALAIQSKSQRGAIRGLSPLSYNKAYNRMLRIEGMNDTIQSKSLDIIGLGLSVGASFAPPALAWRLGLTAIGVDAIQGDPIGMFIGYRALIVANFARKTLDLTYGIWQVIK